jgi:hypothetical protein
MLLKKLLSVIIIVAALSLSGQTLGDELYDFVLDNKEIKLIADKPGLMYFYKDYSIGDDIKMAGYFFDSNYKCVVVVFIANDFKHLEGVYTELTAGAEEIKDNHWVSEKYFMTVERDYENDVFRLILMEPLFLKRLIEADNYGNDMKLLKSVKDNQIKKIKF